MQETLSEHECGCLCLILDCTCVGRRVLDGILGLEACVLEHALQECGGEARPKLLLAAVQASAVSESARVLKVI